MSKTSIDGRRVSLNGPTMGSRWTAVWIDDGRPDALAIGRALVAAVGAVDDQMSTWKPRSDLMRLNRAPVGRWQPVRSALATVLAAALDVRRMTGGAFDVGVGRLVSAWGFGAAAGTTAEAEPIAVETLEVDVAGGRARLLAPAALDLSGIAKGYGVDVLCEVLEAAGITAYLVGIDGEMRAGGPKPDGTPWAVALERPLAGVRAAGGVIALTHGAIATSGDYRQTRAGPDGPVSHTIDPRTGRPVRTAVASVTVRAPRAMIADAMATALMVLGPAAGEAAAARAGVGTLTVLRTPDGGFETIDRLDAAPYRSSSERTAALPAWIDDCNLLRPHSALNGIPPVERLNTLLGNDI